MSVRRAVVVGVPFYSCPLPLRVHNYRREHQRRRLVERTYHAQKNSNLQQLSRRPIHSLAGRLPSRPSSVTNKDPFMTTPTQPTPDIQPPTSDTGRPRGLQ